MPRHIASRGEQENHTDRVWKEYRRACKARLPNWKRYCPGNYAQRSTTTFFWVKKSTASQL